MGDKQIGSRDYEQTTARKRTKKERCLAQMEVVMPWKTLIEPYYPKTGSKRGRPPYPLETMLRIQLMQQWVQVSKLLRVSVRQPSEYSDRQPWSCQMRSKLRRNSRSLRGRGSRCRRRVRPIHQI